MGKEEFLSVGIVADLTNLAYGQQCSICHKFNYFAKVRRSKHLSQATQHFRSQTKKRVHVVDDLGSESDTESLSLDPIKIDGLAEQSWFLYNFNFWW